MPGDLPEIRSKERKAELGEVFTPPHLVQKMLDLVPPNVWADPTKTFLEPSCGNGNFIVAIIQRKLDHGSTIEQALTTTFGIDIDEQNVTECHERVKQTFVPDGNVDLLAIILNNIKLGDFLKAHVNDFDLFNDLSEASYMTQEKHDDILAHARRWSESGIHDADMFTKVGC